MSLQVDSVAQMHVLHSFAVSTSVCYGRGQWKFNILVHRLLHLVISSYSMIYIPHCPSLWQKTSRPWYTSYLNDKSLDRKWLPWHLFSGVLFQFTLGVTEEQQDMIPPTNKSLRQRRCGHCLLQVSCVIMLPWGHVTRGTFSLRYQKKQDGMISKAKSVRVCQWIRHHMYWICVKSDFDMQFFTTNQEMCPFFGRILCLMSLLSRLKLSVKTQPSICNPQIASSIFWVEAEEGLEK